MRTDLFQDKKCVHVKLDKDVHAQVRIALFTHNLSMQELFEGFAELVARRSADAQRILENVVVKKISEQMKYNETHVPSKRSISNMVKRRIKGKMVYADVDDAEALYSMIEQAKASSEPEEIDERPERGTDAGDAGGWDIDPGADDDVEEDEVDDLDDPEQD